MSKLKDLEWLFNGRHFDRDVHPNQITEWKRQFQERAAYVFDAGGTASSEPALSRRGR